MYYEVIFIQSLYRGNKSRNIIKYFRKLPDDIYSKILFYIRQDHYYKRYKNTLSNIIINKFDTFIINNYKDNEFFLYNLSEKLDSALYNLVCLPDIKDKFDDILYLFHLLNKYKLIIRDNNKFHSKTYCYIMYNTFRNINYNSINNSNPMSIHKIFRVLYIIIENIIYFNIMIDEDYNEEEDYNRLIDNVTYLNSYKMKLYETMFDNFKYIKEFLEFGKNYYSLQ